jgi:hypothetical protein
MVLPPVAFLPPEPPLVVLPPGGSWNNVPFSFPQATATAVPSNTVTTVDDLADLAPRDRRSVELIYGTLTTHREASTQAPISFEILPVSRAEHWVIVGSCCSPHPTAQSSVRPVR